MDKEDILLNNQGIGQQQRREFVRIEVSLPVQCRKIREEDLPERQEELALRPSSLEGMGWNTARIADKKRDNVDSEGDFNLLSLRLLWEISNKLNRLIDILEHNDLRDLEKWEARVLDLSGSGIRISSPREINVDEYLQLEMDIPLLPIAVVACIGKVVWTKSITGKDSVRWEAGLKFVAINEDDREEIIRFIFQQQRMLLRARLPHGCQV